MKQIELVKEVANKAEVSQKDVKNVINALGDVVLSKLAENEDIKIGNLGTFRMVKKNARKARNPLTGEEVDVPEKLAPKFRISATVKNALVKEI